MRVRFNLTRKNMKFRIKVKTQKRKNEVESSTTEINASGEPQLTLHVSVKCKPINGEANENVVAVLAAFANVPKREVSILSGEFAKIKIIEIPTIDANKMDEIISSKFGSQNILM